MFIMNGGSLNIEFSSNLSLLFQSLSKFTKKAGIQSEISQKVTKIAPKFLLRVKIQTISEKIEYNS